MKLKKKKVRNLLGKPPAEGSKLGAFTSISGFYIYRKIVPLSEAEKRGVLLTRLSTIINISEISISERGKYEYNYLGCLQYASI